MHGVKVGLFNTITGAFEFPLVDASADWKPRLETGGTISVVASFRDTDTAFGAALWHELTEPTGEFTLVVSDGDDVAGAGVLVGSDMDDDAGTITLKGKDFADHYWPARMAAGVDAIASAGMTYTGRSASGAVRHVIGQALSYGSTWEAPIVLPADGSGDFSADDPWYAFRYISEYLDDIRKQGVEIHLAPRLTGGALEYVTLVGSPIVVGEPLVLSPRAAGSPVKGLRYHRSGLSLRTGALGVGNGEGSSTLTRWAGVPAAGIPIRDTVDTGTKSVRDGDVLQAMVDATYDRLKSPLRSFTFSLALGEDLGPGDVVPGSLVTLDFRGHELVPDGQYPHRVIGVDGDVSGQTITSEVVPYAGS